MTDILPIKYDPDAKQHRTFEPAKGDKIDPSVLPPQQPPGDGTVGIAAADTNTVDLQGTGKTGSPLTANVKLSGDAGNLLSLRANGLYYGREAPPNVATLYVSPSLGNDTNAGTRDAPLATVHEALTRQTNMPANYRICLRSGETHAVTNSYLRNLASYVFSVYDEPTYQNLPNNGTCVDYAPNLGAEFREAILYFTPVQTGVDANGPFYQQALIVAENIELAGGINIISDNPAGLRVIGYGSVLSAAERITLRGCEISAGTNGPLPDTGVLESNNFTFNRVFSDAQRKLIRTDDFVGVSVYENLWVGTVGGCGIYPAYTPGEHNIRQLTLEQLFQNPVYDARTKSMFNFALSWDPWA